MQAHFNLSGTGPEQKYLESFFLHGSGFLPPTGARTLALRASQLFVHKELTERVTTVTAASAAALLRRPRKLVNDLKRLFACRDMARCQETWYVAICWTLFCVIVTHVRSDRARQKKKEVAMSANMEASLQSPVISG